jgi:hypothetical protein
MFTAGAASATATDALVDQIGGPSVFGLAAVILVLMFRTLWRQDGSWKVLLEEERKAGDDARDDASTARAEARQARIEAHEARLATDRCEREHEATRRRFDRLVDHLRGMGLQIPESVLGD